MAESKSVLDNVPVKEDAGFEALMSKARSTGEDAGKGCKVDLLSVVSACPVCGSPVYGKHTVAADKEAPVKRTCNCSEAKSIKDAMQTK